MTKKLLYLIIAVKPLGRKCVNSYSSNSKGNSNDNINSDKNKL